MVWGQEEEIFIALALGMVGNDEADWRKATEEAAGGWWMLLMIDD